MITTGERCGLNLMEEAEKKIKRKTPPEGSGVDTLRRRFKGACASKMKIHVDAEDSKSNEGTSRAPP